MANLILISVLIIILHFTFEAGGEENCIDLPQYRLFQSSLTSPETTTTTETATPHHSSNSTDVYVGYASNPFGPSARLQHKNGKLSSMENDETTLTLVPSTIKFPSISNTIISDQEMTSQEFRSKRGVFHLYNMVSCGTGCNPLIYKGYGCYCGFLGSGYPVDGIDRCCKMHDWCYHHARCPMFIEYFVPYLWKCYRGRPLCALERGEGGHKASCARRLCECDRRLSHCLRRYPCPSSRALCLSSPWRLLQNALMII